MRSIKPGRGPSFMNAMASIVAVIFGIFWTIMASSIGAPSFFPIFGVLFIILGIANVVYNFKNATSKNRYSSFDITDDDEEKDPLNQRFSNMSPKNSGDGYCPYCGTQLQGDYNFCPSCGKKII